MGVGSAHFIRSETGEEISKKVESAAKLIMWTDVYISGVCACRGGHVGIVIAAHSARRENESCGTILSHADMLLIVLTRTRIFQLWCAI